MAKTKTKLKIPKVQPRTVAPVAGLLEATGFINLDNWITIDEAFDLRQQIEKPLSKQQLYTLALKFAKEDGEKSVQRALKIKGVICFDKKIVQEYVGQRGRPAPVKAEQ